MRLSLFTTLIASFFVCGAAVAAAAPGQQPQQAAPAQTYQQQMIDAAVSRALQADQAEEQARLDQLPDVFRCAQMTWLKPLECKELNRQAKLNPGAPMRATTADGVEIVFPPGVSSAEMMHVLVGSEETAIAYLQDMDRLSKHHEKSAANYRRALARYQGTGGVFNGFDTHMAKKDPDIRPEAVVVSVFYESTCPACEKYFSSLIDLKQKYPTLKVYLFQIDSSEEGLARVKQRTGLPSRIMSGSELATMKSQGLTKWPYTLVDNPAIKKRIAKYGVVPVSHLESALARLSVLSEVAGGRQ